MRLVDEPRAVPLSLYGIQRLYVEQAGKVLHVASYVRYDDRSSGRLADWLVTNGITPTFVGHQHVLPAPAGTPGR